MSPSPAPSLPGQILARHGQALSGVLTAQDRQWAAHPNLATVLCTALAGITWAGLRDVQPPLQFAQKDHQGFPLLAFGRDMRDGMLLAQGTLQTAMLALLQTPGGELLPWVQVIGAQAARYPLMVQGQVAPSELQAANAEADRLLEEVGFVRDGPEWAALMTQARGSGVIGRVKPATPAG